MRNATKCMTERGAELALYDLQWPVFDLAFFATLMRWTDPEVSGDGHVDLSSISLLIAGTQRTRREVPSPGASGYSRHGAFAVVRTAKPCGA